MSRDGAGVYTLPVGYLAVTGDTIQPTQHNAPLEDLETDMNTARPIVAGGTGATTASGARTNLGLAIGTDVLGDVADDTTPQLGGDLDVNGNGIIDSNGNELISFTETASAVNEITIANEATTNSPSITATGGDTNITLAISGKGAGLVSLSSPAFVLGSDAEGDIYYSDGTQLARLAAGTAGQALVMNSGATAPEWGGGWTFATEQTPTGGETEFDFTGIPTNVSEISVFGHDLDLSGTDRILVQFGTSGGFVATGYEGTTGAYFGNATAGSLLSSGFLVYPYTGGQPTGLNYRFQRHDPSGHVWSGGGTHGRTATGGDNGTLTGLIDLTGEVTQVRVTRDGSNTFASGGRIVVGWRI